MPAAQPSTAVRPRPEATIDIGGPTDAPPIVLLHGIGAERSQWAPQLSALSDSYRVVALDLPGHGANTARFGFDDAIEQLRDVIDTRAGGRALVAGLSLGGYIAIEAAARSPERFAGLALTGCTANPHGLFTALPTGMALYARAAAERRFSCASLCAPFRAHDSGEAIAPTAGSAEAVQQALLQLSGRNILRDLASYDGPVMIINGERDTLFRFEELTFLTQARDAALQLIPGAGHAANVDAPDAYTHALRRFAASVGWT